MPNVNSQLETYGSFKEKVASSVEIGSDAIKKIEISYDGGRLNIYFDGVEVLKTMSAGIDFSVDINIE